MAKGRNQKLNVLMILVTAVVSALAWFLIHSAKQFLLGLGSILAVGIMSTLFLVVMSLVVFAVSKMQGAYWADVVTGEKNRSKFVITIVLCAIVCFALVCGFEWLYELEIKGNFNDAGTYIFVVDDSGSNISSDPQQMRFKAIRSIMRDKDDDTQYAIYTFADNVTLLQPMQEVGDGVPLVQGTSSGGTSLKAALNRVISDYEQGVWEAEGSIHVILITDGEPTDFTSKNQIDDILERYRENGIPVSSVGLGAVNTSIMTWIADETDGEFIDVKEVDELNDAVKSVARISTAQRDLFSDRPESSYNFLSGIMRIVFVGLLGVMISVAEAFAYGNSGTFWFIIIVGAVKSFVASTFLELGICVLGLPVVPLCLISMTIIGTVVAKFAENGDSRALGKRESRRIDFDD